MTTHTPLRRLFLLVSVIAAAWAIAPAAQAFDVSSIEWETNMDDPLIGSPDAIRGGTYKSYMQSYPLTFRLVGPNSNDAFAGWNRAFTMDFSLVRQHPVTDKFIPWMATHWKVMDDNQTIYYKLDPDARWSDGEPITAEDYAFCYEMLISPHIVDPFYNTYFTEVFESVEAVDKYVVKIVGAKPSWRPLYDYTIFPMPKHAITLDENWVKDSNLKFQICAGPYTISETVDGQRVVFSRVKDWWGEGKRYFTGLYNVDRIELMVIQDTDRALDHFKKGDLSYYRVNTAKKWAEEMNFESLKKGWVHRKRVFIDWPQGLYGFAMNLQVPLFQNKDFRKALQYAFNFDELNKNLMHGAYFRAVSVFEGTQFENPTLRPYGFDPKKAREHLTAAGFTKRGKDGIFVRDDGTRASFTLTYGQASLTRHFTVVKQQFQKLGIEMKLELLEPGTAFERGLEREFEVTIMSRTANFYPGPDQYFGSEYLDTTNNNNIWAFGREDTDALIKTYRFGQDDQERIDAMHKLDGIIQDEAFYIPFWQAPFVRFVHWDYLQFPDFYLPKRFEQITDWQVFWVDPEREVRLADAMKSGKTLEPDSVVDVDPYLIKATIEKSMSDANP